MFVLSAVLTPRRFPPPWSVEELNEACFVGRDHNRQQLAYIYKCQKPTADAPFLWREGNACG
jgi:hypothetical protein